MAHEIETMAYANAVPWHGLGNPVDSSVNIEDMQKAAGLEWSVSKHPVQFQTVNGMQSFKSKFVLARNIDDKPFSVVSDRYKVVQPKEVLEFFRDLLASQNMTLETAGSLRGGQRIWALAKTGAEHDVLGNDKVKGYLLLATSYDLSFSTLAQFTSVRVVCNNTLRQSLRDIDGRVTIPHFKDFDSTAVKQQLGLGREAWEDFTGAIDAIAKIRVDSRKAAEVMMKTFNVPTDTAEVSPNSKHVNNVVNMFTRQDYIGADLVGHTGWGLLNSLTEYIDFKKRAQGQGNRLDNAWFGEGARIKQRGFEEILELAA